MKTRSPVKSNPDSQSVVELTFSKALFFTTVRELFSHRHRFDQYQEHFKKINGYQLSFAMMSFTVNVDISNPDKVYDDLLAFQKTFPEMVTHPFIADYKIKLLQHGVNIDAIPAQRERAMLLFRFARLLAGARIESEKENGIFQHVPKEILLGIIDYALPETRREIVMTKGLSLFNQFEQIARAKMPVANTSPQPS